MQSLATIFLLSVAGLLCVGIGPVALAGQSDPAQADLLLVVAPPWGGGVERRVETAGGRMVGPSGRAWSALATDVSPTALRGAGAWMVLDARSLWILCGKDDPQ